MPPSTRISCGASSATACAPVRVVALYKFQAGSSSRSQWDLLLGSFQNITASIMHFTGGHVPIAVCRTDFDCVSFQWSYDSQSSYDFQSRTNMGRQIDPV